MPLALSAIQGAVFAIVAARLAGGEPLRFAVYGAVGFPLLAVLLRARWPRLASALGLLLVGLWATTCGAMAYEDPSLQAWEWIPVFAFLGLLSGAAMNSYLLGDAEGVESDGGIHEPLRGAPGTRAEAPSPPPLRSDPEADPWSILGIAPGAPPREVGRAFHARMAEYHPDKVATLGVELRELAEAKSKEVTAAYAALGRR